MKHKIVDSITSIELPDNVQQELNKLAEEYRCIGLDEEGLRMFLFERAIKKANNVYYRTLSNEEVNGIIYKYITQLNTKNKLEDFIQNYLNPEIEVEKRSIQRNIENEFIDRLPKDIRKYIEEIKNGFLKYPPEHDQYILTFDKIELQRVLVFSDIFFKEYLYDTFLPKLNKQVEKIGLRVPETYKSAILKDVQGLNSEKVRIRSGKRGRKNEIDWDEIHGMLRFELTKCRYKYEKNNKVNKSELVRKVCDSYNISETGKKTSPDTIYRYLNSDRCPSDIKILLL